MTREVDDFYAQWVATGQFPDLESFNFSVSDSAPKLGNSIVLVWSGEGIAQPVTIYQNGRLLRENLPCTGRMNVAIELPEVIHLRAEYGDLVEEITVTPQVDRPIFQSLKIKPRIFIGEAIQIQYKVHLAERVEVTCAEVARRGVSGGYCSRLEFDGRKRNRCQFSVPHGGTFTIQLKAYSQHAVISEEAISFVAQQVTVAHRLPVITGFAYEKKKAVIGETVRVQWRTNNATRVFLEESGSESITLEGSGETFIDSPSSVGKSSYTLVAENPDGEQCRKQISIIWEYPELKLKLVPSTKLVGGGESVYLNWVVEGAREFWLEAHSEDLAVKINVDSKNGGLVHSPKRAVAYHLVALHFNGDEVRKKVKVKVGALPSYYQVDNRLNTSATKMETMFNELFAKDLFRWKAGLARLLVVFSSYYNSKV